MSEIKIIDVLNPNISINDNLRLSSLVDDIISKDDVLVKTICKGILELNEDKDVQACLDITRKSLNMFATMDTDERINRISMLIEAFIFDDDVKVKININDFIRRVHQLNKIYREASKINSSKAQKIASLLVARLDYEKIEKLFNAVRLLVDLNPRYGAIVVSTYLELLANNYSVFDDIKWFFVLLNRWAESKGVLLPIRATKDEAILLLYAYSYLKPRINYDVSEIRVSDIVNLVEYMLRIVLTGTNV